MDKEKQTYEAPEAMRLDEKKLGQGLCNVGSGDSENCFSAGNSAGSLCFTSGNSAVAGCTDSGNSY